MIQKNSPPGAKEKIKNQILKSVQKKNELNKSDNAAANTEYSKTITIDTSIDEDHPFNIIQKKIDNGEQLTSTKLTQYKEYILKIIPSINQSLNDIIEKLKQTFSEYYDVLNEDGKKEADKQIEKSVERATKQAEIQAKEEAEAQIRLLTRIPEYQKKQDD